METIQELSGTESLRTMPFDTRLGIIARALHERLRRGFRRIRPFAQVAIYALDPLDATADQITLRAIAGYGDECNQQIGAPFSPQVVGQFDELVESTTSSGWGRFSEAPERRDPIDDSLSPKCIDWPVIDKDGKTVALLRADGEDCSKADLVTMRAYAEEVLATFEESTQQCHAAGRTAPGGR